MSRIPRDLGNNTPINIPSQLIVISHRLNPPTNERTPYYTQNSTSSSHPPNISYHSQSPPVFALKKVAPVVAGTNKTDVEQLFQEGDVVRIRTHAVSAGTTKDQG